MAPKTTAAAPGNTRAARPTVDTPGPSARRSVTSGAANVAPANAQAGQGQARKPEGELLRGVKVRATKVCYYDDKRRRIGDVFTISGEKFATGPRAGQLKEFSSKYMVVVDSRTPERITTGAEVLKQQHDEILGSRAADADPNFAPRALGTGDDPAINEEDEDANA